MIDILYTTMRTGNTRDFVHKLIAAGIPASAVTEITDPTQPVPEKFVLFTASYCSEDLEGIYHPTLQAWMDNHPDWHKHCKGTVVSGNRNFRSRYAAAGKMLARQYNIPMLHNFELKGHPKDVDTVLYGLNKYFGDAQ